MHGATMKITNNLFSCVLSLAVSLFTFFGVLVLTRLVIVKQNLITAYYTCLLYILTSAIHYVFIWHIGI